MYKKTKKPTLTCLLFGNSLSYFALSALMLYIPLVAYSSDVITNPVQHYADWIQGDDLDEFTKLELSFHPPETLMKIEADVDGDGNQEIFLTAAGLDNGQAGNIWQIYSPIEEGYKIIGSAVFHPNAFYIGDFGKYGRGIVYYWRGSPTDGMYMMTPFKDGHLMDDIAIRKRSTIDGSEDEALFKNLFVRDGQPVVETISLSDLRKPEIQRNDTERPIIKAYCIDFNWGDGGPNGFAAPGLWAGADPAAHVAWYKAMGVNTVQTFCVSCNGYAWYKDSVVPEQPGLKHDFLREVVRLGHAENMQVMGYFCIGANTRWGQEHPELSYGIPATPHIPYTKPYLAYLDAAIRDAVGNTGIDGFMADWVWQPERKETKGQWLACEKELYAELMGHDFPGETTLTDAQYLEYSRKAIAQCWQTIHKAAKETNPDCIIWLTCHTPTHPHVVNSDMFKEVDWLMNEAGDMESIDAVTSMTGKKTRLITCLAFWNKQDPVVIIPEAIKKGIGLYGFTKPLENSLLPPVESYLEKPLSQLEGDGKNIAALARVFLGMPLEQK